MKKRCLSVILILILTFGTCGTVLAEDSKRGTGDDLKSYGKIAYQNGSDAVVIDSEDFHMLADRLDLFKQRMADQLQAMHTYFTVGGDISLQTNADVSVVHTKPSDENIVNPLEVDFDTLLEGIAVSQSVSSDVTAYGFPAGTEFYKNENGVLTTDGTEEGAEKISVAAATADNLSAGTAAWVNGSLILGTGEDNKSYSDSGYSTGYTNGYNEGKKAGVLRVTRAARIDDADDGVKLYVGNHQYFFMVGTNNYSFSPAPIERYEGHGFIFFRIDASSNGGYINFPRYTTPVTLCYLSIQ